MLPLQSGPWSDGNKGVLSIPQNSGITGASPSDCLVLYPRHWLGGVLPLCRSAVGVFYSPSGPSLFSVIFRALAVGGASYSSAEKQSVYSTDTDNWVIQGNQLGWVISCPWRLSPWPSLVICCAQYFTRESGYFYTLGCLFDTISEW